MNRYGNFYCVWRNAIGFTRKQAFLTVLCSLLLACTLTTAQATPLLRTEIVDTGLISLVVAGTDSIFYTNTTPNSGRGDAEAVVRPSGGGYETWHFDLYTAILGYHVAYSPGGHMIFNDVIFTDTANPTQTGTIEVSANFWVAGDTNTEISFGLVSYLPGPMPTLTGNNLYNSTVPTGSYTTGTITVPLNEPLSFSMKVSYEPIAGYVGTIFGPWIQRWLSTGIDAMPFNLPAGYTVNSVDAMITNNTIGGLSSVADLPTEVIRFHQNTPNPFNPSTVIAFELAQDGPVSLAVFDLAGRRIRMLIQSDLTAGRHSVVWDGRDGAGNSVGSGVYLGRLESGRSIAIHKMVLTK